MVESYSHHEQQAADEMVNIAHGEGDQRSRRRFLPRSGWCCVGFHPHRDQESEREHGERDGPIPAMPGANCAVVQPDLPLGQFEAFLDRLARARDTCQRGEGRVCRTEGDSVRHVVWIVAIAPDQQPLRPGWRRPARQTHACPVTEAFALRPRRRPRSASASSATGYQPVPRCGCIGMPPRRSGFPSSETPSL